VALLTRKAKIIALSRFAKPIRSMDEVIEQHYRAGLGDMDENRHMNNARYLQYMELGRWDMMVRTGFLKFAAKHKVMAPVANLNVVYRRALKYRERFSVRSRIAHWNDRVAVFEHLMLNASGEVSAIGLVECRVLSKDKSLTLGEIVRRLEVNPGKSQNSEFDLAAQSSSLAKAVLASAKGSAESATSK
jgi:YbgC/YbaW family acyl-CoA thioester hydrolase